MTHICLIDAHPDPADHLCHALADAYAEGAREAGHSVERIDIAKLDLGFLDKVSDFETHPPEPVLSEREKIKRADHVCIIFPLWLGNMPAKAKAFFELAGCGNFFLETGESASSWPKQMMKGKSARTIVTMGMPGFAYKLVFDAGALKALERGLFGVSGFKPVRHTVLGGVEQADEKTRKKWFQNIHHLAQAAE
ncbi:NAD(P)H-dependent oxidoreductase [Henriciella sp.]|uniref:NAD(P)H-dependent oxidoreductase n=1 Tax=Henriciella sp. TaxID=1968823 RepID=UPI00262A9DA2|nr:NAD(P)H-dependent oxidoreductase [Henriciella sp.]